MINEVDAEATEPSTARVPVTEMTEAFERDGKRLNSAAEQRHVTNFVEKR
jgi:hypothetical protein